MFGGYSVGIEIHLVDHVSLALHNVSRGLAMAQGNTQAFQKSLEAVHTKMMRFQAMEFTGNQMFQGAAGAINQMIEPAKEYAHQLAVMKMNAMDVVDMQGQIKAAWDTSFEVPSTPTENLQALMDMRTIFGGDKAALEEARHLLPEFKKIETILTGAVHDPTHNATDITNQIFAAVKAMEMQGKIRSPEQFQHGIEEMTKVMVATGGRVLPSDYQSLFKFSRAMKLTLDDEFLYNVAPELILEMKSSGGGSSGAGGPGAMIAALGRALVQDIMADKARDKLGALGLLNEQGQFIDRELAARNPERAVNEIIVPAIIKQHPEIAGDEMAINLALADLRLPGLSSSLVGELFNKNTQFDKMKANKEGLGSINDMYENARKSPSTAEMELNKAWTTLMTSMGEVLMPFLPMVNKFSEALRWMAEVFRDNPWIPQMITFGIIVLAVVGAIVAVIGAIGGAALIFGALSLSVEAAGLIIGIVLAAWGGLTSLLYLFANLGPKVWESLTFLWKSLTSGLSMAGEQIQRFWNQTLDLLGKVFLRAAEIFQPFISFINPAAGGILELAIGNTRNREQEQIERVGALSGGRVTPVDFKNVTLQIPKIVVNGAKGQSEEELAKQVQRMLTEVLKEGLLSGVGNTGLHFGHEVNE